jgi:hypothetical protein
MESAGPVAAELAGHATAVQTSFADASLRIPAAVAEPVVQMQLVATVLAAALSELAGHAVHPDDPVPPSPSP